MTSVLEFGVHMFTRCSIRFKMTHFPAYLGGWAPGGVCIFLEIDQAFEFSFWKTTRRDRVRVFDKFEIPHRVRGLSWNQKKRLDEAEASPSIHVSIHRSLVSPTALDKGDSGIGLSYRLARLHRLAGRSTTLYRSQVNLPVMDYEFGKKLALTALLLFRAQHAL
jgi:hypothetical protein